MRHHRRFNPSYYNNDCKRGFHNPYICSQYNLVCNVNVMYLYVPTFLLRQARAWVRDLGGGSEMRWVEHSSWNVQIRYPIHISVALHEWVRANHWTFAAGNMQQRTIFNLWLSDDVQNLLFDLSHALYFLVFLYPVFRWALLMLLQLFPNGRH